LQISPEKKINPASFYSLVFDLIKKICMVTCLVPISTIFLNCDSKKLEREEFISAYNAGIKSERFYRNSLSVSVTSKINSHGPDNLIDNLHSGWCEGKEGNGVGEKIIISTFQRSDLISKIYIKNGLGLARNFKEKNRVKDLEISAAGLKKQIVTLKDDFEIQEFNLISPVAKPDQIHIAFTILSIYPGRINDTCISEIGFSQDLVPTLTGTDIQLNFEVVKMDFTDARKDTYELIFRKDKLVTGKFKTKKTYVGADANSIGEGVWEGGVDSYITVSFESPTTEICLNAYDCKYEYEKRVYQFSVFNPLEAKTLAEPGVPEISATILEWVEAKIEASK
jgi:hypothetical protein